MLSDDDLTGLVPVVRADGYRLARIVAEYPDRGEVTLEMLAGRHYRFQVPQGGQPGAEGWQGFRLPPGWREALGREDVRAAMARVRESELLAASARDDMNKAREGGAMALNRVLGLLTGEGGENGVEAA